MLKSLKIKNFTVFSQTNLSFSPGINVFIGGNGMGKSHLLKLGYTVAFISHEIRKEEYVTKKNLQGRIAEKLNSVFRPEYLGRLARRKSGRNRCEIDAGFALSGCDFGFSFASNSREEVSLNSRANSNGLDS